MVVDGVTIVLPFVATLPIPLSMLQELAPDDVHDRIIVSGGTMVVERDGVNVVIVVGGTHAAWHCA